MPAMFGTRRRGIFETRFLSVNKFPAARRKCAANAAKVVFARNAGYEKTVRAHHAPREHMSRISSMSTPFLEARVGAAAQSLVIFRLDDRRCALKIAAVKRVLRAVEIVPVPDASAAVLGVINVQGEIIPVFDLRARLNLQPRALLPADHLILVTHKNGLVSLVADEVLGVFSLDENAIVESGELLPGLVTLSAVSGIGRLDDDMVFIYNIENFLSLEEAQNITRALHSRADSSQQLGQSHDDSSDSS